MQRIDRTRRVGELIRRALPKIIQQHCSDWGLGLLSVTGTEITKDLKEATVYISTLGTAKEQKTAIKMLNEDVRHFRKQLSVDLNLRHTPTIEFRYDSSIERGIRLTRLIDTLTTPKDSAVRPDD